jgi:hypothetical protein
MDVRRLAVPVLAGILLASPGVGTAQQRTSTASLSAPSAVWGAPAAGSALSRVLSEIRPDGTVSLATALEAFSLVVGPVPGATAPKKPIGEVMDGTFAVRWALGYWDQLTPAQRAAVKRDLSGRSLGTSAQWAGRGQELTRWPDNVTPPAGPYLAVAEDASKEIAAHIGHPLGIPISVVMNATEVQVNGISALAYTWVLNSSGGYTGTAARCEIHINPSLYTIKDSSEVNDTVVHEVFHCYQGADYSSLAAFYKAPAWLIEGSAEWVGETLAPSAQDYQFWRDYLLDINTSLLKRSYDAIGFYAHMAETGINPWQKFDLMFKAPTSIAAYDLATDNDFLTTWASSLLRKGNWGEGWDTTGPAIPPRVWYIPKVTVLAVGGSLTGYVAPYTNAIVAVNTPADTLQVTVNTPYSRLHDTSNHDFDDLMSGPNRFCLNDCASSAELAQLPRLTPGEVWLALTGNNFGATYTITATNGAPCLVGNWVTTAWTASVSSDEGTGSISGGAGIHFTITSDRVLADYDGMAPVVTAVSGHEAEFTWSGEQTATISYSQSATAKSGSFELGPGQGDVTLNLPQPVKPIKANPLGDGGTGTWTCSASTMTWHAELATGTGNSQLNFARNP